MKHDDMNRKMFGYYLIQGKTGIHYCPDWDSLAIHDDMPEAEVCCCDLTEIREMEKALNDKR